MLIAVSAATGQLGRLVIERLKAKVPAANIVALTRSAEKGADLGVSVRVADYAKPETLGPALAGVDTLLLISSNEIGQRTPQHKNVIAAAKQAGLGWIIYTSLLRADSWPIDLAIEHWETEQMLAASGIPYTVLRNSWYHENYAGAIAGARATGALLGSAGDGKISSAARADYADAAVAVLTGTGHQGKTYELAGDTAFTLADLAAEISRQLGREIPYRNLPVDELAKVLASIGVPEPIAGMMARWEAGTAEGRIFDDGRQLSRLIGRPTTPVAATVRAVLG
ncbi:MAG: SDR family oxidoreductase [Gemmatimonadales bacterium]|nr:SDR family oxidoreductase [Gemmatimonadales bacterium]